MTECIDCGGTPIEAFGRCATCNGEQRKAEKRAKKVKIVTAIPKVTESRATELKQYPKLRKGFLLHKMVCELKFPGCLQTPREIHHKSLLAKNFLNTKTWLALCPECHRQLENMPAEIRREKGFLTD